MSSLHLIPMGDAFDLLAPHASVMDVLDLIHSERPFWIAGGYLRDQHLGRGFKDIDVFFSGTATRCEDSDRYGSAHWITVAGTEVNLIFKEAEHDITSLVQSFDIGLCQIIRARDGAVYATDRYLKDVRDRTITVLRRPEIPSDFEHIQRVHEKFPNFTVIHAYE